MRNASRRGRFAACMITGLLTLGLVACGSEGEIHVSDAWVAPNPAGNGPAGGYFMVHNGTGAERSLVAVESPAAARVELHRSWLEGDVARMGRVESVALAPDAHLRFEPGGYHLMLFEFETTAESVALRLRFDDGSEQQVDAAVRAAGGAHHDHHDH